MIPPLFEGEDIEDLKEQAKMFQAHAKQRRANDETDTNCPCGYASSLVRLRQKGNGRNATKVCH